VLIRVDQLPHVGFLAQGSLDLRESFAVNLQWTQGRVVALPREDERIAAGGVSHPEDDEGPRPHVLARRRVGFRVDRRASPQVDVGSHETVG